MDLHRLYDGVILVEDIIECVEEADRGRLLLLGQMLLTELQSAQDLERYVVETWNGQQQGEIEAIEVANAIGASFKRFNEFRHFSSGFIQSGDEFLEAIAHIEGVYCAITRTAESNLRVARGLAPIRPSGYPDEFIGPTGHISF